MSIEAKIFETQLDQNYWLAGQIQEILTKNPTIKASEIAIIARKHQHLMSLAPILEEFEIPIAYERRQNVLEKKEILELIQILRFVDSSFDLAQAPKEELLPQILSFEFWRLSPSDIFELSRYALDKKQGWLVSMLEMDKPNLKVVGEFLIELAKLSKEAYLEQVIDEVTGISKQAYVGDSTDEEAPDYIMSDIRYDPAKGTVNVLPKSQEESQHLSRYISPFKWYYFDQGFEKDRHTLGGGGAYLSFLSALKVFRDAVRSYKASNSAKSLEILKVKDLLEYVDLLMSRKLPLNDESPYNSTSEAVSLLTAHKAKGLEFEFVFVINCTQDAWNGKGIVNKIGLPANLALLPQGENLDDSLRLFFVALTRAKTFLTLTSFKYKSDGKETQNFGCLAGLVEFEAVETDQPRPKIKTELQNIVQTGDLSLKDILKIQESKPHLNTLSPLTVWFNSVLKENKSELNLQYYLKSKLEIYKLSVTHLNSFLDLVRGGPLYFLEQNLFGFPQAKSPNAAYGTAMHASLNEFYKEYRKHELLPSPEFLLEKFRISLLDQRLLQKDERIFMEKGIANLSLYYQNRSKTFRFSDRTEEDFKGQGVTLGQAKITGKIDKIIFGPNSGELEVVDFKTGKAHTKWADSALDTAVKLQNYRRQLVFYKLLVENSRDFSKYKVYQGSLEFLDIPFKESQTTILSTPITDTEANDLAKLIEVVYSKIMLLGQGQPLPDVSGYTQDLAGIEQFIQDLLTEF